MNSYPIASELSYLVLQKQRVDPEVAQLKAHQSAQGHHSAIPWRGLKAHDAAITRMEAEGIGDELRPTPTWHRHGKR